MINGYSQSVFMEKHLKKSLLPIFLITILSFFFFLGINYTAGSNLASLYSVITARVVINPLEVDVFTPTKVEINKVFKVRAKIINKGEEKIKNAKGEIFLPEGIVLIKKNLVQKMGVIPGKKSKRISWTVRGTEIGEYVITVSASAELKEELIAAEDSTAVKIIKKKIPGWWQDRFNFLRRFFGLF